jgi:hypothetical protein
MFDMTEAQAEAFAPLAPSGLASGTVVQDALEGGTGTLRGAAAVPYRIRAVYLNTADMGLFDRFPPLTSPSVMALHPEGTAQSASEYRSIVASLASGQNKVDVYIEHPGGISKIPAGQQIVEGAPLPAELRPHLPPSFATAEPPAPTGGGGAVPPAEEGTPAGGGLAADETQPAELATEQPPSAAEPVVAEPPEGVGLGTGEAGMEASVGASRISGGALAGEMAAGLATGLAIGLAIGLALDVAGYMLSGKGQEDPEVTKLKELIAAKVTPAMTAYLTPRLRELRQFSMRAPELDQYANVTVDLKYIWDEEGDDLIAIDGAKHINDVEYVGMDVGMTEAKRDEKTIATDKAGSRHYETIRVTYSTMLNPLDEKPEMRHWRTLLAQAATAVQHGISVRGVAESTHWAGPGKSPAWRNWTHLDDREEKKRERFGMPSRRDEVEHQEREAFAEAYVEYAAEHDLHPQYEDGVRYLQELQREDAEKAERERPQIGFGHYSRADERVLEEFLKGK